MSAPSKPSISQQLDEYFALKDRHYVPLRDASLAKMISEEEEARNAGIDPIPLRDPSPDEPSPSHILGPKNKLKDSKLTRLDDPIPPYRSTLFPRADESFGKANVEDWPKLMREQRDLFKKRSPGQLLAGLKEQGLKSKDKEHVEAWKTVVRVTAGPATPTDAVKGKGKEAQGKKGGKR